MAFHDIAGNGRAKAILRMALGRDRVPNSLLFSGPRGVGKRRTARVLAQALNCLNRKDDACGACGPCRAIGAGDKKERRGTFPDVQEIEIREDKTEIVIDQMRELRAQAYLKPMVGRRRVFIVTAADTMDDDAANALLKILEEPPLFTHIVLLCENPAQILPTIKSRCQILTFLPVSDEEVERSLRDIGIEAEKARIMALVCRGNIEKALEMDWDDIQAGRRDAWSLFSALVDGSDPGALLKRFAFSRGGAKRSTVKDDLAGLLEQMSTFGRDAVLLGEGGDPRLLFNPDFETELQAAAVRLGPGRALRFIGLVHGAAASLDRNGHFGALTTSLTAQWLKGDEAR
jgi:DNA polymerase-3 subunit delta'